MNGTLEKDTQKTILAYLAAKRIFHYRNNSGGAMVKGNGDKGQFIRFGAVGSPDIICVIYGHYIGIEVKGPKGKQSDHQKAFQEKLNAAGGIYLLVHSFEEFMKAYPHLFDD